MLGQSSSLAGVALPNLSNSNLGKEPLCLFFDEQLPLCNESDFVLKVTGPPPPPPECELLNAVILISLGAGTGSGKSSELIISEAVVPWSSSLKLDNFFTLSDLQCSIPLPLLDVLQNPRNVCGGKDN